MDRFSLFRAFYEHTAAGGRWSESVVEWAVDLLGRGTDTPNLRILAGLSRAAHRAEVDEYFMATLADLHEPPISDAERCLGVARVIAAAIAQGDVDPTDGVAAIHSLAVSPLGHPAALQAWCDLDSGFRRLAGSDKVEFLADSTLDAAIRAQARDFLSADANEQLRMIEKGV